MRFINSSLPRNEPFYWWGPALARAEPRSLAQLVDRAMLSADEAAMLAALFQRGASIFVVSLTSGAGKSTLLDAVVQSGAGQRQRIYLRGLYETFDFVADADLRQACLLVNEISPHLPIYLWGAGVRDVFEIAARGVQLCATAHAADAGSLLHLLTSSPLNVPLQRVHQPKVIVALQRRERHPGRVISIVALMPGATPQATVVSVLAERNASGGAARLDPEALVSFLRVAALEERGFFEALDQIRQAVATR